MHQEIVTLRQIFKTALRHGWVDHLPDFSAPYRASPKISHLSMVLTGKIQGSFMRQRGNVSRTPSSPVFVGKRNNFTIMF